MASNTTTQITPPRVAIVDPTTGIISREWYRFFLSVWNTTNNNQDYSGAEFSNASATASLDQTVATLNQVIGTSPDAYIAYLDNINKNMQALAITPVNTPQLESKRYGYFYDLTDQTAAAINTAYAMSFGNTQYSNGVTIGSPTSRVYVDRPTIYNIQFSAQLDKSSASQAYIWIWLDKNGTTVNDTATQISLQGSSAAAVAAWNFLLEMNAGDYFRLMWSTDDTGCYIKHATTAAPVPAIPSVILSVTDNIK